MCNINSNKSFFFIFLLRRLLESQRTSPSYITHLLVSADFVTVAYDSREMITVNLKAVECKPPPRLTVPCTTSRYHNAFVSVGWWRRLVITNEN